MVSEIFAVFAETKKNKAMETSIIKPELSIIQSKIHEIRGYKIILDYDLAEMYQVETKALNQAVKRNIERFPADFMFKLTDEENINLMSHFVTSSWGGTRKLPYAFTEQGVAMLSGLIRSEVAIKINIAIMRAFVVLRQYYLGYSELKRDLQDYMSKNDSKVDNIYELLDELITKKREMEKPRNPIGYIKR